MTRTFIRNILVIDDLPTARLAVYIFLEFIALGFALEAVASFMHGESWWKWVGALALGVVFLILGVKSERIIKRFVHYLNSRLLWMLAYGVVVLYSLYFLQRWVPDLAMNFHQRLQGGLGYATVALLGAILSCGLWWFSGRMLVPSTASESSSTTTETDKPKTPAELHLPQIQISRDVMPLSVMIAPGAQTDILTFGQDRSINFQHFTNDQNKIYVWPPRAPKARLMPDFLFRYQLINQSKTVVYNLQLPFRIEFGQAEKGWIVSLAKDMPLEIGLLAPSVPYVFYAINQSAEHVMIMEPATIRGQLEGESYLRDIPLGKLIRNPVDFVPLTLVPTHNSWEGNRLTSNAGRPKPLRKK
jgi:hypothetical protein